MTMRVLEICVDSLESAVKAASSGADRLEICQDLSVGGLTPTAGFITIVKELVSIPVFALIRPRPGNFQYNEYEVRQMLKDIEISKQVGADGFVFGALDKNNEVDINVTRRLVAASYGFPMTFHRAFDEINDKGKALEDVISFGFQRVLTSGGEETAIEGLWILQKLMVQAGRRIIIMPGGGITDNNVGGVIYPVDGRTFMEIHSSGRSSNPSSPTKKSDVCSEDIIKKMKKMMTSGF